MATKIRDKMIKTHKPQCTSGEEETGMGRGDRGLEMCYSILFS